MLASGIERVATANTQQLSVQIEAHYPAHTFEIGHLRTKSEQPPASQAFIAR
jgi:hypothetical protein